MNSYSSTVKVEENVSLKPYNTFGIDARAESLFRLTESDDLNRLQSLKSSKPILILGGGSNILFTQDFAGTVILNELKGIQFSPLSPDTMLVKAAAGENWHSFVMHCIENEWGGIENLSLIPGKVGASPMQNIGAYGVEIKDTFHSLEALDLHTGLIKTFYKDDCRFGYRESIFKNSARNRYLIVSVTFGLSRRNHQFNTSYGAINDELEKMKAGPSLRSISNAVISIRRSKLPDPAVTGNAGSFFKNPVVSNEHAEAIKAQHPDLVCYPVSDKEVKLAAGWLIERAGWKGFRKGQAGVHPKQALVLVNYGGARGSEILELSQNIMDDVANKFGVQLQREVNVI